MKNNFRIISVVIVSLLLTLIFSCKKEVPKVIPTLTTTAASSITSTTATSGGTITNDGGAPVTSRGVCWSLNQSPTTSDNKTSDGSGIGSFTSSITGLTPGATYYARTYAINSVGAGYGSQISFVTDGVPILSTTQISSIGATSATSGGNITSDGGEAVTVRGVCWSTNNNPTTSDNKTSDGSGMGGFSSSVISLIPNTTYYIRAYATNNVGTGYGLSESFTTKQAVYDIEGNAYTIVAIGTQTWMAENLKTTKSNDGTSIPNLTDDTAWGNLKTSGYCWNKNNVDNKDEYGALYNWYTVDTRILCPSGWHIPTDSEWTTLITYLGGQALAGNKLKEGSKYWSGFASGITNESGFSARAGGYRGSVWVSGPNYYEIWFSHSKNEGMWWSSTNKSGMLMAWYLYLSASSDVARINSMNNNSGASVRCVKN